MSAETAPATTVSGVLGKWLRAAFEAAFPDADGDFSMVSASAATNPEFGDYQCNDAMRLAKVLGRKPRDIAQAVLEGSGLHESLAAAEVAGPGFINMTLKDGWLVSFLEHMLAHPGLGVPDEGRGATIVIDYPSPNAAKSMHIGHIRSIVIGSVLDRLFRRLGYRVIADNHLGDWGTQFGILIKGYRELLDEEAMARDPLAELERLYVASFERSEADESWLAACRGELVKLQSGDPENRALWQLFIDVTLREFNRVYERLGMRVDHTRGESYYSDRLADTVALLEEKGLARESEGATVVFLEEEKLPACLVRKSDGGFLYASTDIATVLSRIEEFQPAKIIYVTDERQQLHFRQFFAVCGRLGCETELIHVWFGLVQVPGTGVIKTRKGTAIKLEELLDEAERRALEIVKASNADMPAGDQLEIARAVGIGAVKYTDLCQNPQTAVTFTWDKAMALDGNSGPYLQYAYARIASVKDKYAERFPEGSLEGAELLLTDPVERVLVGKLALYPDIVAQAAMTYRPNLLCDYVYDLAQTYSTFYQNVPFLKAPERVRESRVRLCTIVARILADGLSLLGIETPDRI